jgi:DNA-binding SARP family transcriptional activator
MKKEEALKGVEHPSKRRRLDGGGRRADHSQVEEDLAHWIVHEREQYHKVTRKAIALRASQLINDPEFNASRGWVDRFLKRHCVLRARTTTR